MEGGRKVTDRDLARRRAREPVPVAHAHLEALPDEKSPPVTRLLDADERAAVRQAVQELPDPYRTLVLLYFFNRLSYQEISETLQVPIGTVGTQLHRAKRLLRQVMIQREVVAP